ncbi:hypothetical protein CYMTET_21053 [Cymbomonas tetramitiformis]|uniref:Lipoyl-binding domain-containing protein n=1 Tax=Cymbomonas tetramitiformis TaxID=36881 RepID=A0AAE0G2U7_9CHLO|nr:hypothetical protein CYMTET_27116 [Cymbomonas tetramitiformis]KAK3270553.1 hypothetical protein CYMTET_21053 [Cymbomonas tetramitiformis]
MATSPLSRGLFMDSGSNFARATYQLLHVGKSGSSNAVDRWGTSSPFPLQGTAASVLVRGASAGHMHTEAADEEDRFDIKAPFISDQVSIPDGIVGEVAEIVCEVGEVVAEGDIIVIIETHKAAINVKATGAPFLEIVKIMVTEGQEVRELESMVVVQASGC